MHYRSRKAQTWKSAMDGPVETIVFRQEKTQRGSQKVASTPIALGQMLRAREARQSAIFISHPLLMWDDMKPSGPLDPGGGTNTHAIETSFKQLTPFAKNSSTRPTAAK
jgi:hypothetical protein